MHEDIRKVIEDRERDIENARKLDDLMSHLDEGLNPGTLVLAYYVDNRDHNDDDYSSILKGQKLFYGHKQTLLFGQIGTCARGYDFRNYVTLELQIPASNILNVRYNDFAFERNVVKSISEDPKLAKEQNIMARRSYERVKDIPAPLPVETAPDIFGEDSRSVITVWPNYMVLVGGEIPQNTVKKYMEFFEKDLKEMVKVRSV